MSQPILLEMRGVYAWKPAFQRALLPCVKRMARSGLRANHITCLAAGLSIVTGGLLLVTESTRWFLLLPPVLLIRMALNAADGMLARQFGQQSRLGAYLNELGDIVSDVALYLPFLRFPDFGVVRVSSIILLSVLSEVAGLIGPLAGASRRYDGPMGKSDRAVVFGSLGLWIGFGVHIPEIMTLLFPKLLVLLLALTIFNRIRAGLKESNDAIL